MLVFVASPLKLLLAGTRASSNGSLFNVGSLASYWSSTVSDTNARTPGIVSNDASMHSNLQAFGYSVRCIKD
ncbi:hypothetical protein QLX67_01325 [Balneolaceae bacterium ANBcel3]|nr:hypothetical protein [Balneolaceae bacterium ANBcel3]